MTIDIKKTNNKAILPYYSTDGSGAFDLFCYKDVEWDRQYTALIDTGIAFQIPEEYSLFIFSRSGHGFKSLTTLVNSVGIIDEDYIDTVKVKLICHHTFEPYIEAGTAVAQGIIMPTPKVIFNVVDKLKEPIEPHFGFGSTGM